MNDFTKAIEALRKANVPKPYVAIVSPNNPLLRRYRNFIH